MEKEKTILDYDTVALDEAQDAVIIIDQTLLPGRIELIALHTAQEIWDAIYLLKVRGAPAIGVAAALGIYLLANRIETEDFEKFYEKFTEYKEYLDSSRPTAVNLSWALKRMNAVAVKAGREEHKTVAEVKEILHDEALQRYRNIMTLAWRLSSSMNGLRQMAILFCLTINVWVTKYHYSSMGKMT